MHKAAQLAAKLEQIGVADGVSLVEVAAKDALYFDVCDDAMCIMHSDGSVNIVDSMGGGNVSVETISAESILKVLNHYRPFKDVFKGQVQ